MQNMTLSPPLSYTMFQISILQIQSWTLRKHFYIVQRSTLVSVSTRNPTTPSILQSLQFCGSQKDHIAFHTACHFEHLTLKSLPESLLLATQFLDSPVGPPHLTGLSSASLVSLFLPFLQVFQSLLSLFLLQSNLVFF